MGDERSELKKSLRRILGLLAGFLVGNYIVNWHVIHDHGFKAVRYDHFLAQAVGAIVGLICIWLLGRQKEVTTLGIGEAPAKKLQ